MTIEWLAPASTLVGTALGWSLTRLSDTFKLKSERHRRGSEYAAQAMDAILLFEREIPYIVYRSGRVDPERQARADEALQTLYRVSYYVPDRLVRQQLKLAHNVLGDPDGVSQWAVHDLGMPRQLGLSMCCEIKEVLGAYLRDEKTSAISQRMRKFDESYDAFIAELANQQEQNEADEREERRKRREARGCDSVQVAENSDEERT
ncbi:hypothetical protein [Amycolatopsis sp. WGS_07]|uniref:hypothetical protein n=1 Tax=Amycolatopsis sp. WGS_07 TaxID=3076764 RepID=UPI003872AC86